MSRKIIWAKSSRLHGALSEGGLNIGSLKSKNLALLCKWLWRFRVENNSLWAKIIKAIHGIDGGLHSQLEAYPKGPWGNVIKAGHDVLKIIPDFGATFERIVGRGRTVRFWHDSCIGGKPLCLQFRRLFALDPHQEATVADKILWLEGKAIWNWEWRHDQRGREAGEYADLTNLLRSISLSCDKPDGWTWSWSTDGRFSVKVLTSMLDGCSLGP